MIDSALKEEFSGLLYELLSRLPRILKDGIKKITSEGMAQTYDKYTRGSNPVKYFVEKGLEYPISGAKTRKLEVYEHYEKFCREFGLAPESDQSFSRRLSDEFHLMYKRGRINGEQVYCWEGVRLRDWEKEENDVLKNLEDFSDSTREEMK